MAHFAALPCCVSLSVSFCPSRCLDLFVLCVVKEQNYCVEATAGSESANEYVSLPGCDTVLIQFEAAILVRVNLDERGGSLPVEGDLQALFMSPCSFLHV